MKKNCWIFVDVGTSIWKIGIWRLFRKKSFGQMTTTADLSKCNGLTIVNPMQPIVQYIFNSFKPYRTNRIMNFGFGICNCLRIVGVTFILHRSSKIMKYKDVKPQLQTEISSNSKHCVDHPLFLLTFAAKLERLLFRMDN